MDAPTTAQEIKAAYKELYLATANALDAQRAVNARRYTLKDSESVLTNSEAVAAGKNAETRAAILFSMTGVERLELRRAEDDLAAAEREQTLAKIVVNELRELLRLAEWWTVATYDVVPMTWKEV
jgi:hypothetical protein